MSEPDFVAFIEACYRVELPEREWLEAIARAALPLMSHGLGIHAYDVGPGERLTLRQPMLVGGRPEWDERWEHNWWQPMMMTFSQEQLKLMHTLTSVSYAVELWGACAAKSTTYAEYMARFASRGYATSHRRFLQPDAPPPPVPTDERFMYPDSFNVCALDATGCGVMLAANMPAPADGGVDPRVASLWGRLGAHLAAAYRLRRRLGQPGVDEASGAVFDPDGRVQHADRALRDSVALAALRERVASIDHLRAAERGDGLKAVEVWRALHEERWSLVDRFDRDGRRFYVARANTPGVSERRALTERETQVARAAALGHSNKLIAYELGITPSTVATHLKTAARKLGVDSRLALIRAIRRAEP